MNYDDCYKLSCMEILELMHTIDESVAVYLHSILAYHVCTNVSDKMTHCLFVSVLYSIYLVKDSSMKLIQSYSLN